MRKGVENSLRLQETAEEVLEAKIDCCFPYNDRVKATALIIEARAISLNASFIVLHELCRPPKAANVGKKRLRELLAEWADCPDHNLKTPILSAAHSLIEGKQLPWRAGVELMQQVSKCEGQWAALAIAYFASDCSDPEGDEALNQMEAEVRRKWAEQSV